MLTGSDLGAAIERARLLKGITKAELAQVMGVRPPSVQDWVKRGTINKEKLSRLWTYFSDVAGPEHWGLKSWDDADHPKEGLVTRPVAHDLRHLSIESGPYASLKVPVIGTLVMGVDNMHQLRSQPDGKAIGTVSVPFASAGSFAVQVFGDELYPAVRHGSCLVVDPISPGVPGELVLIELADGNFLVCELVAEHADALLWVPAAGGSRRTLPAGQIAKVMPVVGLVPGSRMESA